LRGKPRRTDVRRPALEGENKQSSFLAKLENWWTYLEENGHWVVLCQRPPVATEIDAWGYPAGEMILEIESLLPKAPAHITTHELAAQLSRGSQRPTRELLKSIQKHLRALRNRGAARSVRLGNSTQLGWCITYADHEESA
jgi:DNA-binding transcriptional ArsR family regulator